MTDSTTPATPSMTHHTPEPWLANQNLKGDGSYAGSMAIWTNSLEPAYIGDIPLAANAARIVACVNACAGIPTEALEAQNMLSLLDDIHHNAELRGDTGECFSMLGDLLAELRGEG